MPFNADFFLDYVPMYAKFRNRGFHPRDSRVYHSSLGNDGVEAHCG